MDCGSCHRAVRDLSPDLQYTMTTGGGTSSRVDIDAALLASRIDAKPSCHTIRSVEKRIPAYRRSGCICFTCAYNKGSRWMKLHKWRMWFEELVWGRNCWIRISSGMTAQILMIGSICFSTGSTDGNQLYIYKYKYINLLNFLFNNNLFYY